MQATFRTERLDVYKTSCQRDGGYTTTDVYLGYHRQGNKVYPCFHNVICSTVDVKCVAWIETVYGEGQGYASELLRGIVEHEKLRRTALPRQSHLRAHRKAVRQARKVVRRKARTHKPPAH